MTLYLRVVASLVTVVLVVIIVRALMIKPPLMNKRPCKDTDTDFIKADSILIERFQQAIRYQTVSFNPGEYNTEELLNLQKFIFKSFPHLHSSPLVTVDVIANYSLLYHIKGQNESFQPYLLMGHLDVVPVDYDKWEAPPFSGDIKDGFIYGRGTIDDKITVFGILEAVEYLLKKGYHPKRSFYISFGHDEEVKGEDGAAAIAARLAQNHVQSLEYILDEGLAVLHGLIPGIHVPTALIGTSEKGWLQLKISVKTEGGHSSMPRPQSSIGILSQAVQRLENNPQPSMFGTGPEIALFEELAYYMDWPYRLIMSNLWIFGPLVAKFLEKRPSTNAIMRTTTAITEFHSGIKDNVIPPYAWATINHRIHPGQTKEQVIDYDRQVIDDERVVIEEVGYFRPHPISPSDVGSFGYQTIKGSIEQVWGSKDVVVSPGLTVGNTDTKHYLNFTNNIYRFAPTYMYPEDLVRFHGHNERISLSNYEEAVNFYYHVIMNSDAESLDGFHEHTAEL